MGKPIDTNQRTRWLGQLAKYGIAAVLIVVMAFGLWVAYTTRAAATRVRTSSTLSDQFEQARYAVGAEESLERKYRLAPSPEIRAKHRQAGEDMVRALGTIRSIDPAEQAELVDDLLETHVRYRDATEDLFSAIDAGDVGRTSTIDETRVDPVFHDLEHAVGTAAAAHRAQALTDLTQLDRLESLVVVATPVVSALGLMFLVLFSWVLRTYERREEATRAIELRRKQQHARLEALRALGQMTGGIAHDLNQSLGLIAGYSDLIQRALERTPPDLHTLRTTFPIVQTAALDGGEIVKRLLSWTRHRRDDTSLPVDLGALLREVAELTAPRWRNATQLEGRPISLFVTVDGDTAVTGRPSELREALTNLVFNAIDALPGGGTIELIGRRDGAFVEVLVTDPGVGMPPDVVARIFDPFFTTKGELGTGLGLAQVRSIVEGHGGAMIVQSTLGVGTTIGMRLASARARGTPAAPVESVKSDSATVGVLVVDDEANMRLMVRTMLEEAGHRVATAESAEEALGMLNHRSFELIISDVGMGAGLNGWEFAERVRESWPATRFALATGWGAQIDPAEARTKGVDAVIAKPYGMKALLDTVREAMSVTRGPGAAGVERPPASSAHRTPSS